jgi:hypothetical protein
LSSNTRFFAKAQELFAKELGLFAKRKIETPTSYRRVAYSSKTVQSGRSSI